MAPSARLVATQQVSSPGSATTMPAGARTAPETAVGRSSIFSSRPRGPAVEGEGAVHEHDHAPVAREPDVEHARRHRLLGPNQEPRLGRSHGGGQDRRQRGGHGEAHAGRIPARHQPPYLLTYP